MRNIVLRQGGFTLLEVMVALTIFSVGLLGIAGMQYHAQNFNSNSAVRTQTASLANMVMEEILACGANCPPQVVRPAANLVWDFDPGSADTFIDVPGSGRFNATYSIGVNPVMPDINVVSVTVTPQNGRPLTLTSFSPQ